MKFKLLPNFKKTSKSERLIYVIILLWVVFGIMGVYFESNLAQIAGYYASLTLFTSTYLWGEYKRTSNSSHVFKKGKSSSREIVIYVTVFLWALLGMVGIWKAGDINQLTVYFAALTPFVSSYIIYKTSKGKDLPIFDGKSQELVDASIAAADITITPVKKEKVEKVETKIETSTENDLSDFPEDEYHTDGEQNGDDEDEVF